MTIYSISNVTRKYGDRKVLDIDWLEIQAGNIYALLGPNGAGKTTLLNILAFIDQPTSGHIHFYSNRVIYTEKNLQPLRKKIVMVGQSPILFTTTVYKNIEFGLKIRKYSATYCCFSYNWQSWKHA